MTLKLYYHPIASHCWKVMIALHEAGLTYEPVMVDLMDPAARAEYRKLSPFGKIPTLVDSGMVVNETSIQIEHLVLNYSQAAGLLPKDPKEALKVRALDRFFDLYLNAPLGKIVVDRISPPEKRNPDAVAQTMNDFRTAVGIVERDMASRTWAAGETFTMADCAAAPALFYVDRLVPYAQGYPNTARYLERLLARPSVARCIEGARPMLHMVPY
jgi:glutathione S-transferase